MAKRSPNYPQLTLREALEAVRKVYTAQHTYPAEREVVAQNLGYKGLNGASLPVLGALNRYGLLVSEGEQLKVSDDAVTILELPADNEERQAALRRAAYATTVFNQMSETYGEKPPNDVTLRHDLIKKKFLPKAADEVIRIYRDNLELVTPEAPAYTPPANAANQKAGGTPAMTGQTQTQTAQSKELTPTAYEEAAMAQGAGVHQFSFPLSFQRDVKATITIYGDKLKRRDLEFLKKKVGDLLEGFEDEEPEPQVRPAMWRNKDHDQPVTITGELGEQDGKRFYTAKETSTGIPEDELEFEDAKAKGAA